MSCQKTPYSKRRATETLNTLIDTGKWNHKGLGRVYHCKDCNCWHITHLTEFNRETSDYEFKFKKKFYRIVKNGKKNLKK